MRIKLAQRQSKATPGRAEGQVGQVRDEASSRSTGGQVVGSLNKTAQKQKKKKKRNDTRSEPNRTLAQARRQKGRGKETQQSEIAIGDACGFVFARKTLQKNKRQNWFLAQFFAKQESRVDRREAERTKNGCEWGTSGALSRNSTMQIDIEKLK